LIGSAGVILVASFAPAGNAFARTLRGVPITTVSRDPYTNPTSYHRTQVEPDTFSWGSTIVGVFQSGRFKGGGANNIGWATSTDNGQSWKNGFLPGTTVYSDPPGSWARLSNPSVAYDARHGVWMAAGLAIDDRERGRAVLVSRSTDGGLTWRNPVTVSERSGSDFYDKDWIACDNWKGGPNYGNCYAQWDLASDGDQLRMSRSQDGGLTWREGTVAPSHGIGGQPLSTPNGDVVVPFASDAGPLQSIVSKDGGKTYEGPFVITTVAAHAVTGMRAPQLPSADIDSTGKIYVACTTAGSGRRA
jgi:hypothetical protein